MTTALYLPIGLVLILLAACLVVCAIWPARRHGSKTLTTPSAHGLRTGDTFHLPGDGLCVVLEVSSPHSVTFEPQHSQ